MPELPEVETLKCSLEKQITGHKITSLTKFRDSLRYKLCDNLEIYSKDAAILNVSRVAKYVILELDNGNLLVFHLGMTGRLTLRPVDYIFQKHDHLAFALNDMFLVFNDARRFGMVYTCAKQDLLTQKYLQNIGPEPFSSHFNAKYLLQSFKNKKMPVKSAIMDNRIVVGIGNIYASESLFLSKINPLKSARDLNLGELEILVESCVNVLKKAIKAGGTTLRDFVNGDNKPGYFKQKLMVYGRNSENCKVCNLPIVKIIQSGRATYFCPSCQI